MFLVVAKEPQTINKALSSPEWLAAMQEEINTLHQNKTWTLVPKAPSMNIVGSRWVFKTKLKDDGSIDRYKSKLVAKGYSELEGVDFEETFSRVVKVTIIRVVLSVAGSRHWCIEVTYFTEGIHLNQNKYAAELLAKNNMALAKPISTTLA
uniref:Uncharacterized mitochondrial protein AtMg00820-like n=1 Tax=Nicotiana tabacum TaxID=4097 RepID=A0A1S4BB71_TOBAC|nr:PREDICTED: uncharacterized mitochondrial protein AtMg00820-like [Nicotiana tabacum]